MPAIHLRAAARLDLIEHFVHLADHAGTDTAERFLEHAQTSFDDLALQPTMGAPLTLRHPDLGGLRKWRVKGFDNHMIFYMPRQDGVSIVRVLHASRDWWGLLGIDS
jgi:toxin ParE1/3/4